MPNVMTEAELDKKIADVVGKSVADAVNEALAHLSELPGKGSGGNPIAGAISANAKGDDDAASKVAPGLKKGETFARVLRAMAAAKGDPERAQQWAEKTFGKEAAAPVVKALSTDNVSAGGFLVQEEISDEVIELFRPASVVMRMNPQIIRMDRASFSMPKLLGGASASYIGENADAPATQLEGGSVRLTFHKLAALVPVSNDMLRYAAPGSDTLIRDDLVAGMAQRSDLGMLRDNGTADTLIGLRYQVPGANVLPANATVNLANVTFDLGSMILALLEGNVRMIRPGWIFAPRTAIYLMTVRDGNGNYVFREEMMQGRLWGYPYATTTQIPTNLGSGSDESEIMLADFADVVVGEGMQLQLDASTEAAYINSAGQLVSAFSKDQTVVRAIMEHDLAMRHNESLVILTGVKWAP